MIATQSGSKQSANAYAQVGLETGVLDANPHKLILMLFEGVIHAIGTAQNAMAKGHVAEKGQAITRAIEIISNGLRASLDLTTGFELANRLDALYEYMCDRLLLANLQNNAATLTEVMNLVIELKSAWEEIAKDPAVVSDSRKAA